MTTTDSRLQTTDFRHCMPCNTDRFSCSLKAEACRLAPQARWTRKALAILGLAVVASGCHESLALDPMSAQRRYGPYQESFFFADGRAMQAPPAGTVAFTEGGPAAVPPPVTRALLERGRNRFEVFCATCHGLAGDGRSLVAQNMALRPPPSLHDHRHHDVSDFHSIATNGFGLMPGYSSQLTDEDRWAVAFYVLALQRSQWTPLDEAPPDVRERLQREAAPRGTPAGAPRPDSEGQP